MFKCSIVQLQYASSNMLIALCTCGQERKNRQNKHDIMKFK